MKKYKAILGLIVILSALDGHKAIAQSTLFNIPSTDVVTTKKVYAEFDFAAQMPKTSGASRIYGYVPRLVVGIARNIEAGVNVSLSHTSGFTQSYFQPNVKWRFANSDPQGLAASVGTVLDIPMNNRGLLESFGVLYGNVSKKVKSGSYGPRFTAGPYTIYSGGAFWAGPKSGAILGLEQPIHSRVSIVADWVSGVNAIGYFTPGVSVTLPRNGLFNAGYSIGNDSFGNNYYGNTNRLLFLYYGVTF